MIYKISEVLHVQGRQRHVIDQTGSRYLGGVDPDSGRDSQHLREIGQHVGIPRGAGRGRVAVLLRVYAKCIAGQGQASRDQIGRALGLG